jgi:3-oxoacyl-[acyl-carrier protein] reductase
MASKEEASAAKPLTQRFEGKFALITGGSKGIGAAIAVRLAREGAHVCIVYGSDKAGAERTVEEIESHGIPKSRTLVLGADVSKPEAITAMFDAYFEHWPRLDVCIPNAGASCALVCQCCMA